ncbi:DUF2953 domain-containing protein [Aquibacillus koreensis]|uniref:DUF2953 domain-containing protein n=1 Tax=Aquibacillus koreensis TaxID=279446 RepID=A0A9X4AGU0_9BACI|nr:DUF2953 domain-containing protein [Aquibacillus koreensis]MCT2534989.1 DUF2953 domain-containing protein [Aquibacillus koreensis]MDC3419276.1 DUF2953 domain-containing protein [Aquibacillus koreensis]
MIWLFVLLALLLFFIFCLFLRIYTVFHYIHHLDQHLIQFEIRIAGIRIKKMEMDLTLDMEEDEDVQLKTGEEEEKKKHTSIHTIFQNIKKYRDIIKRLVESKPVILQHIAKINIHKFEWSTKFGVGDASHTGILSGAVWGIKGCIVGFIINHMRIRKRPKIEVIPLFQQKQSYTAITCIASIRLGQAIYAIIQLTKLFQREINSLSKKTA